MGTLLALEGAVAQGLLYAIMTLGVYITYKLLDFADLTVDGSFALGGCVSAILITVGLDPFTSLLIATLAGMASGVITGFFNTVFKIPPILSGILTMLALYSINLRVSWEKPMCLSVRMKLSLPLFKSGFRFKPIFLLF